MTGDLVALGPCGLCGGVFGFDPETVPSIVIDPVTGLPPDLGGDAERARREPVCDDCVAAFQKARKAHGLPPVAGWPRHTPTT